MRILGNGRQLGTDDFTMIVLNTEELVLVRDSLLHALTVSTSPHSKVRKLLEKLEVYL